MDAATDEVGRAPFGSFVKPVVIFDFDGTLADTGPTVLKIGAYALEKHGYRLDEVNDLRLLIGPPLEDGFMQVAGIDRDTARELVETYRVAFANQVKPGDYPPFPGIPELLDALVAHGHKIAVATSRLERSAQAMISSLPFPPFDACSGRLEPGRHTKAECIRACLDALGARPGDAVMVGDRHHDVEGAHEVGIPCIGVARDGQAVQELCTARADAVCADSWELAALLGVEIPPRAPYREDERAR